MLVLSQSDVEKLLPMNECIEVMAEALAALARGECLQPLRTAVVPPKTGGVLALMPSFRGGKDARYGLKAVCVFPGNPAKGLDAHQGGVLLFSGETGEVLALMNASAITAIRTAAVSAVATRLLAHEGFYFFWDRRGALSIAAFDHRRRWSLGAGAWMLRDHAAFLGVAGIFGFLRSVATAAISSN